MEFKLLYVSLDVFYVKNRYRGYYRAYAPKSILINVLNYIYIYNDTNTFIVIIEKIDNVGSVR